MKESLMRKFYQQRERLLKYKNVGMEPIILLDDHLCKDLKDETIRVIYEIGKGAYGRVFSVTLDGESKEFALKQMTPGVEEREFEFKKSQVRYSDVSNYLREHHYVPPKIFYTINNIVNPDETVEGIPVQKGRYEYKFNVPKKMMECPNVKTITHPVTEEIIPVPYGSWICYGIDVFAEFYFAQVLSQEYTSGKCINFLQTYGYSQCIDGDSLSFYILMEMIDEPFDNILDVAFDENNEKTNEYVIRPIDDQPEFWTLKYETVNPLIFQVAFALSVMQEKYNIVHCDLHPGNVFLSKIDQGTVFNKQNLDDADYYHYQYKGVDYYFPREMFPYIVKIGDFGLSKQFLPDKFIVNKLHIDNNDQYIGEGGDPLAQRPSWMTKSYDILFFLYALWSNGEAYRTMSADETIQKIYEKAFLFKDDDRDVEDLENDYTYNQTILPMIDENVIDDEDLEGWEDYNNQNYFDNMFSNETNRPLFPFTTKKDSEGFSPGSLLTSEIFKEYTKKPSRDKKVVTLGRM